jgi:protein-L-isoaspartate(D-aspartate) O-methyltransferase
MKTTLSIALLTLACSGPAPEQRPSPQIPAATADAAEQQEVRWTMERERLVEVLVREGISDAEVLRALRAVPRHAFVPTGLRDASYANHALPIGLGQTISQPYVVAYMTEVAELERTDNVLEVGTGSGYQVAVLAEVLGLGPDADPEAPHGRLCSIEILPELSRRARAALDQVGYREIELRVGDGYRGWPERAPFDAILVTAAPDHVPEPLTQQLASGGRLVIPVGEGLQYVEVIRKRGDGSLRTERRLPVRFVPMTGEAQQRRR